LTASDALVRRAGPEDAGAVAELIYATSPKLHDRFVGGKAQSLVMLTNAFASPGNNVSAEVVHVAELSGRVAGAMACFAIDEARRRGRAVLRVALGCTPLHRWPAALSIYLRGGQMTARPPARSLYVDSIATDERLRRRGAARALLARAEELARSQGLLHVSLDTDVENMPARHLYESSGFIGVAETRPRGGLPGFVSYVKTL
jgi:GNAT superfamily N-acetyltransferase